MGMSDIRLCTEGRIDHDPTPSSRLGSMFSSVNKPKSFLEVSERTNCVSTSRVAVSIVKALKQDPVDPEVHN